ncbi:MAG: hypothetical protein EPO24_16185 [Bacteroidetes bacterium]|nr:MAG: hypothetical protein EPO24_16185 [Bacteroidota bacterium]
MNRTLFINFVITLACLFLFMGDSPTSDITILFPPGEETVSYDQGQIFLVSALNESVPQLLLSTQWNVEKVIPISVKTEKESFPREFYSLFPQNTTVQSIIYTLKHFNGYSQPETLNYAYQDTVSIKALWKRIEFAEWVKKLLTSDAMEILFNIRGWQDSLYTPTYEDPMSEGRTLYKLYVQLLPGKNEIYASASEKKTSAALYATTFVNEAKAISERTTTFHNSILEQSCTSCHEGLPSADSGASMNADCSLCHKERTVGALIHSPVEAKECGTCHTWSSDKKSVVVESGVPETCFGCHSEIQETIDNATVPHPVASECGTCHSPHNSREQHLLKENVFLLCTSCHEDHKINHPVGRHPLRFVKNSETGEELSCITCHTPHGSHNQSLLKVAGEPTQICSQCH